MYKFSRKDLQIVKELIEIHNENDDHENAIEWAMDVCGHHDDDSASTEAWFTRYNAITDEVCRRSRCRERWGQLEFPALPQEIGK